MDKGPHHTRWKARLCRPSHIVLPNTVYVGEVRGHDRTYPGIHKPIIAGETWETAQIIAAARKRKAPDSKKTEQSLQASCGTISAVTCFWKSIGTGARPIMPRI
jgi:hypothetical protein